MALEDVGKTILIIDEKKVRRIAKEYHLEVIGTLKVLLLAKQKGFISSVRDQISLLSAKKFRFDQTIVERILMESNELN